MADYQLYGCCSLFVSILQCFLLEGENRLSVPIVENVKKDNKEQSDVYSSSWRTIVKSLIQLCNLACFIHSCDNISCRRGIYVTGISDISPVCSYHISLGYCSLSLKAGKQTSRGHVYFDTSL